MGPFVLALALSVSAVAAPIPIEREGSFTAGGTVISGEKGTLHCDHGFVDYQVPLHAKKTGLFLWHSSSVQVKGNTHIAFADLNNVQVADQLSLFLKKNKLDR